MRDITDLVGLACVLNARNGANVEMTAQICADVDRKTRKGYGTASLLPHKKLSNGDRVAGGTRRTFEAKRCETESKFINLRSG